MSSKKAKDIKLTDVKYTLPNESADEKETRLKRMSADLLNIVLDIKQAYTKNGNAAVKEQLKQAVLAIEDVDARIKKTLH